LITEATHSVVQSDYYSPNMSDMEDRAMDFEAYCVKCRQKRPIKNGTVEKTKTGRHAAKGVCPVCGTKVTRFISSAEAGK
jgi:O-acetyl-ADP-ribose deacetylase (regulator of RNase III)